MISEGFLWLGAWIIVSEIIFVIWMIKTKDEVLKEIWFLPKVMSFLAGLTIVWLQLIVLDPSHLGFFPDTYNWINILYEGIVIGSITLLFLINQQIVYSIKRNNK